MLPLAAALLAGGCSTLDIGIGAPVDLERCATFEPGRTSRAEVLAALGPPSALARHGDGVALLWEHVSVEERQLGISFERIQHALSLLFGSAGIPAIDLLKVSLGRSGSHREAALLTFDSRGTLTGCGLESWSQKLGKGGAAQLLVSVDNVVDSGAFRDPPLGLTWGRELLEPLPAGLNRSHRPDIELRAAPLHAGQRTLETADVTGGRRAD